MAFRILYNRWISTHRSRQRRPAEVSVDEITERDLAAGAARAPAGLRSAETEVLDALPDSLIRAAMEDLPADFRAAVYYADVQGYTYAETAAILNIPMGTAMSRASRARRRLRIALAEPQSAYEKLTNPREAPTSGEHRLTVDVEQILLGALLDARRIAGQRHRDFVAGVAHHVERQLDGFGFGEVRAHPSATPASMRPGAQISAST